MKEISSFFICKFDAVSSTQDELKKNLFEGIKIPSFSVISSDFQTQGRGRSGKRWNSKAGQNALFSFVTYPKIKSDELHFLYQMAAVSVVETIFDNTDLYPVIKYPNDVLMNGKKIAGILVETAVRNNTVLHAVTGIGLNVNQTEFSRLPQATSLFLETGKKNNPVEWVDLIVRRYKNLMENHTPKEVFSRYVFWWDRPGVKKGVVTPSGKVKGRILNIKNDILFLKNEKGIFQFPVREISSWV